MSGPAATPPAAPPPDDPSAAGAGEEFVFDALPPYLVPHNPAPVTVFYDDGDLLLVDKPDLLLTVPGRHPLNRDCMITRLHRRFPDALIVHRLDLDTSGLLMVARGKAMQGALSRLFQERAVHKRYRAWVAGVVDGDRGTIDLPIARDWERRPLQKICHETGKQAITHFTVLRREARRTLLELAPLTGRTHQLRIHCRELGHPILGCDLYAPSTVLGAAPRLMLHATHLRFRHPRKGIDLEGHSSAPF